MKVLLTGATGLVGQEVGIKLVQMGHSVSVFSRSTSGIKESLPFPCEALKWDLKTGKYDDPGKVDAVINLAGSSIAEGRWNEAAKREILESRLRSTELVCKIAKEKQSKVVVNASAIGFYGDRSANWLEESSEAGTGFLAQTCQSWEKSLFESDFKGRKCALRIGVVLSRSGGMIKKVLPIFLNGAGGPLGNGQQFLSWIHIEDLVRVIFEATTNEKYQGVINAVSGEPSTNVDFTKLFSDCVGVPAIFPAPSPALKLVLGEMSEMVLGSQRVRAAKLKNLGFDFKFKNLKEALVDQVGLFKGGVRVLETKQYLPREVKEVWPFFSSEKNLEAITPDTLKFHVLGKSTEEIQKGTLINYKLKIHGFPANWQTEIKEWLPMSKFIDVQKKGPFALWHHTHSFEALGPGTLMSDQVMYKLPMGIMGRAVAGAFIANDVGKIFEFRNSKMREYFP
jgi:uncharacterized protein (TIGR01777 family)